MKIPDEWNKKNVDDLFIFTNGNGFKTSDWSNTGLPIIRIQNLNGSNEFNFYKGKIKEKWLVNPGQLLFAWAGTRGVSFGPKIWNGPQGVLNQHIYKLDPKIKSDNRWLYYAIMRVTGIIEKKAHGFKSTLLHVQKSDITNQVIKVPPLPEQKAIAELLSTWDEAIEKTEQLIQAKEKRFKWLLQKLISEGRSGTEWKKVKIGSFLTESRIFGTNGLEAKKITVKLYGKGVLPKSEKRIGSKTTKYFVRRAGQFIYSKLDFLNGAFGIVPEKLDSYESTLDLPAFDIAPHVSKDWFLYYLIRPEYYTRQIGLSKGQRKARRVNPTDFLNSKILLPSLVEQKQIAETLNIAQKEINLLKQLAKKYKAQKRGLMQKLLTGEWRIKPEVVKRYA